MRTILIILFIVNLLPKVYSDQVGGGFITRDIKVWRYWQNNGNEFEYKIIVFNVSNSSIQFSAQQRVYTGSHFKVDTTYKKYYFKDIFIDTASYVILDHPQNEVKDEHIAFIINGETVGLFELKDKKPPIELAMFNFISDAGLNGSFSPFWIAKKTLFSKSKEEDSLLLFRKPSYDSIDRSEIEKISGIQLFNHDYYFDPNEELTFKLQPSNNVKQIKVTARNRNRNNYNLLNELVFKIPLSAKHDSSFQKLISISYKIEKKAKYYIGMHSSFYFSFNKLDKNNVSRSETAMNGYILLPILVE